MNRVKILAALLFFISLFCQASTKDVVFNIDDFHFDEVEAGIFSIGSSLHHYSYVEGDAPAIPSFTYHYLLPYSSALIESNITHSTPRLIKSNITLCTSPTSVPSCESSVNEFSIVPYTSGTYPAELCEYISTSHWRGVMPIAAYSITPFIYDASERNLYFIDKFSISMELEPVDEDIETTQSGLVEDIDILKVFVDNSEDVENFIGQLPENINEGLIHNNYKYVIITSHDLKESFKPLLRWKTIKGYPGIIVTTQQIRSLYAAPDLQLAIKIFLYDLYVNYGLEYVVLGGDETIVPTRICYVKAGTRTNSTPADKYYACFDGNFSWNANNNVIYGEEDDDIDFNESIYVSRIPIQTCEEAEAYISNLLRYEQCENSSTWNESILTSGTNLKYTSNGQSDAEIKGDVFLSQTF